MERKIGLLGVIAALACLGLVMACSGSTTPPANNYDATTSSTVSAAMTTAMFAQNGTGVTVSSSVSQSGGTTGTIVFTDYSDTASNITFNGTITFTSSSTASGGSFTMNGTLYLSGSGSGKIASIGYNNVSMSTGGSSGAAMTGSCTISFKDGTSITVNMATGTAS
jgi:hypothetical protein